MSRSSIIAIMLGTACVSAVALGQDAAPKSSAAAPPGEEVMKPTPYGLRFTPQLSDAIARSWLKQNIGEDLGLSDDQRDAWTEKLSDRAMEMTRQNSQLTREFFEGLLETAVTRDGRQKKPLADRQKEMQNFAQRVTPIIPMWQQFLDGANEDAQTILNPDQQAQLKKRIEVHHKHLENMQTTLNRWGAGQYSPDDGDIEQVMRPPPRGKDGDDDDDDASGKPRKPSSKPLSPEARQARRMARWEAERIGSSEWTIFVTTAKNTLKYTVEQSSKADALLAEYRKKADAIMTPEWKNAFRDNRMRSNMRWQLNNNPIGPWAFHIDREYNQMITPIIALQKELYGKVLALATDEQRTSVIDDISKKVAEHGLTVSDADRALMLGLLKGPS